MMTRSRPVHGGLDHAELAALGLDPGKVIDFSASINPLGTPSKVKDAIARVDPAAYPDRECLALRNALGEYLSVDPGMVLAGNGSTDLIHCLARAYLPDGRPALVLGPTFCEYEAAVEAAGGRVQRLMASEKQGFRWDTKQVAESIGRQRPALVFLCNPNNPTGVQLPQQDVEGLACAALPGLLIVDEAYMPFSDEPWDAQPLLELGNVALLRSMTKDFGLAGVRLGYLLGTRATIERVRAEQASWSVSALAQAAGIAALRCPQHLEEGRRIVAEGKAYLQRKLQELGLEVFPSSVNFILVRVGDGRAVRRRLLERGLCVRDCASFGLPAYIRIGIRTLDDCRRLATEMERILAHG